MQEEPGAKKQERLQRWKLRFLGLLAAELAILVITGIALYFLYRPTAAQAWDGLRTDGSRPPSVSEWLRVGHGLTSTFTLPTVLITAVLVGLTKGSGRRWNEWKLAAGLVLTTVAATFTGYLLPWDQLALWAVKVGTNLSGYQVLFGDQVRFVLIGGVEIAPRTIIGWLLVHTLLFGPALVALTVLTVRRRQAVTQE